MGLFEDRSDKTELPTAKRRTESRKKGKVAASKELSTAVLMLTAVLLLQFMGSTLTGTMQDLMARGLTLGRQAESGVAWAVRTVESFVLPVLPLLALFGGILVFLALVVGILQSGFKVTFYPLIPKTEKINPIKGIKRIFSISGLQKTGVALFKFALLAATLVWVMSDELPVLMQLQDMDLFDAVPIVAELALEVLWWIAMPLLVVGLIDLIYQRWDHTRSLKMSKQEVKDEQKGEEGDPELKARIRRVQREMAARRMMEEVPKADVVITNPTHFAVALGYDRDRHAAPKILAKGVDDLALRIREVAKEHEVPIWEDPPLARSLHRSCEIDDEIPAELYQAVATILAEVLRLKEAAHA